MDQFYGDRSGQLEDPFGHLWWVATHKEDVAPEEMQKRAGDVRKEVSRTVLESADGIVGFGRARQAERTR